MQSIPMLPGKWVSGHMDEFRDNRLDMLLRLSKLGPLSRARILNRWIVLINEPELIHEILVEKHKQLVKSFGLRVVAKPILGEGLLRSEGDHWRKQRRIMASVLQADKVASFAHCMVDCAMRGVAEWKDEQEIDLVPEMVRVTLSIVSKTLFGAESFHEATKIGEAVVAGQEWMNDRLSSPLGMPLWVPTEMNRRFKAALAVFDDKLDAMVAERRDGKGGHDDLLAKLLAARDEEDGQGMSEQQVRDEVMNLFVAGHETTSAALAWSIHLLLDNPAVLERARTAVDALGDRRLRADDLPQLRYLGQVFKEAMRLYPPAYVFGRTATAPITVGKHTIDKDVTMLVCPWALHRRADLFPEPERFNPDRFSEESEEARPRYRYVPFGGGPRVCIGMHYALQEGTLVLATLLQRIDFTRAPGAVVEPEPMVTLKPKSVRAIVKRRARVSS